MLHTYKIEFELDTTVAPEHQQNVLGWVMQAVYELLDQNQNENIYNATITEHD